MMSYKLTSPEEAHNDRGSHVDEPEEKIPGATAHVGGANTGILEGERGR